MIRILTISLVLTLCGYSQPEFTNTEAANIDTPAEVTAWLTALGIDAPLAADDLEAAAAGVSVGEYYQLADGSLRKRIVPDEVVTYASTNHIGAAAATELGVQLNIYRSAGIEPSLLWVGGNRYNKTDQTAVILGDSGSVVGSGDDFSLGDNHIQLSEGKVVRVPIPPDLKGTAITDWMISIVHTQPSSGTKDLAGSYETGSTGPRIRHTADGGDFAVETWTDGSGSNRVNYFSQDVPQDSGGWISSLYNAYSGGHQTSQELRVNARSARDFWNDGDYFYIGAANATDSGTDGKIAVVMLAARGSSLNENDASAAIRYAPWAAGIIQDSEVPVILYNGDSHIASSFGFPEFVLGVDEGTDIASGGQWTGQHILWDGGWGGEDTKYFEGRYDAFLRTAMRARASGNLYYMLHVEPYVEATDPQGVRSLEFADRVAAETGAKMILASYTPRVTNADATAMAENAEAHAAARGWGFVPFFDTAHGRITDGGFVEYGYYTHDIDPNTDLPYDPPLNTSSHSTPAGRRIKSQIFAAAIERPGSSAPRWDLADLPAITGSPAVGGLLSVDTGTCRNSPDSYTYQWLRNLAEISGATSSTYTVVADDEDKYLSCRVTAVKSGENSAEITSDPTLRIGAEISVDLFAWWALEEATGNRLDAHSDKDLIPQNIVSSETGQVGTAVNLPNSKSYLRDYQSAQNFGAGFSFAGWVKTSNSGNQLNLFSVYDEASTVEKLQLQLNFGRIKLEIFDTTEGGSIARRGNVSTLRDGSWHFVVATWDGTATASGISLYVDGTEQTYTDQSSGSFVSLKHSGGEAMTLSRVSNPVRGALDECAVWTREINSAEASELWNAGSGVTYADL